MESFLGIFSDNHNQLIPKIKQNRKYMHTLLVKERSLFKSNFKTMLGSCTKPSLQVLARQGEITL